MSRRHPRIYTLLALGVGAFIFACANLESPMAPEEDHAVAKSETSRPKTSRGRSRKLSVGTASGGSEGAAFLADEEEFIAEEAPAPSPAPPSTASANPNATNNEEGAPTRAWFPETFLFEPEVITGTDGTAVVTATVPDRLTTWRVLGLAHDKNGHQAGDVEEFTSSLPLYADPVVPAKLRVGDRARLAIPVVNTTKETRAITVNVRAEGVDVRGGGALRIPAYGSDVAWAQLAATRPGSAVMHADINENGVAQDAVKHTIPILPSGRRHTLSRTGTLGAPRTVALPLPANADPMTAEARLTVVPGGLGIVQSEVAHAHSRARGGQGAAVLLQLATVAPILWESAGLPVAESGEEPEARARWEQVRRLRLMGIQRAAQVQGTLSLPEAIALTAAAAGHAGDPLTDSLAQRSLMALEHHRHPDGTFGGSSTTGSNWTVQRLLVATGAAVDAARSLSEATDDDALQRRVLPHIVLASGAAERFESRVVDGYTASALLASGLVEGESQVRLLELVRASVTSDDSGGWLKLPEGVVRIDGQAPPRAESAALAARALAAAGSDEDADRIADLGATVLSSFQPGRGWGDLNTDYACLRAVTELWSAAPSEAVTLTLARGTETVARRTLATDDLRDPVFMTVPATGEGDWTIQADPAVPGLAYGLELVSYTPWTRPSRTPGLDVEVRPPSDLRLGQTRPLSVDIAAPRSATLSLHIQLPAGVQVDEADITVRDGSQTPAPALVRTSDGEVHLLLAPIASGRLQVEVPVSATIAGTLWSGSVEVRDEQSNARTIVPPTVWTIGSR